MDVRLAAFASELTKLAEAKKERQSYAKQVALSAPAAMATAAAKIPEGALEKAVESTVEKGRPAGIRAAMSRGVGKASGRLAIGLATTPAFLSGVKDIKEAKTPEQKRRGYAKVLGAGMVFSAGKGAVENVLEPALKGQKVSPKALRKVVGGRAALGLIGASLTAGSIAKSLRKPKKGKKKSKGSSLATPAAVGGALGALEGTFDSLGRNGLKALKSSAGRRKVLGPMVGKAVAGAAGAVALTEIARKALSGKKPKPPKKFKPGKVLKPSKKDPTVRRWQSIKTASEPQTFGPTGGALYDQVRGWSKDKNEVDIYDFYKQIVAEGQGERTPSRRAAHYALVDEMKHRGRELPEPQLRRQVTGKVPAPTHMEAAALAAVAFSPAVAFAATANLPQDDRDRVLADALDRQFIQGRLQKVTIPATEIPAYSPVEKKLYLRAGEAPGVIAHELGHEQAGLLRRALLHPKDKASALKMQKIHEAGKAASIILPLLAVGTVTDQSFATPEELESRANLARNVGLVAGLAQAPLLAEETLANRKAVQLLQRAGASRKEALMKVLKQAGPGFATYAVPALFPFLVARHLRNKAAKGEKR
jgi:hypothetical protein